MGHLFKWLLQTASRCASNAKGTTNKGLFTSGVGLAAGGGGGNGTQ